MPLRSMTGFGQAAKRTPSGAYRVEIRGVNNRYLDVQIRTPRPFANLDQKIKKALAERISRGSLTVAITWDREDEQGVLTWDRQKVGDYVKIFGEIKKKFKLSGDVTLGNLLVFSDFITSHTPEHSEELLWRHVRPILSRAIDSFQASREAEAAYFVRDLRTMVKKLRATLDEIKKHAPARIRNYSQALAKRAESLAAGAIEPQRLAAEIALMADRLDISEECTRLAAHIEKFSADLDSSEPAGKRMTFVLQEMNREANTIASKANDTTIAHLSVEIKEEIEKMREQAQNIE